MARQTVAWVSFVEADYCIKQIIRKMKAIPDEENISTKYLVPGSFIVALINTICVMPLDSIKTFFQKVNPTASWLVASQ